MNLEPPDTPPTSWTWHMSHFDDESRRKLEAFIESDETELVHEYQLMRDPHNVRIIEVAGRKIPGARGKRGRLIGVSWDVTADRTADRRLADMQARFQSVFDNSVAPMAIMDGNTWILMANDAHCELVGYSREEIIGTDLMLLAMDDDRELNETNIALLRNGQIPEPVEQALHRKDGSLIWVMSTISELRAPTEDDPGEFLIQLRDITQERETAEQLRHLAEHDPLTGLLNRRAFDLALKAHVDDTARGHRPAVGALLLLDLDHFKLHNDRYGHAAGDAVLVAVADVLRQRLRGGDAIGRLGGDEFAVLLPDTDATVAQGIAGDVVELIAARMRELAPDSEHPVTASAGLTDFLDRPDAEEALRRADGALYEAKGEGRDRWSYRPS
jgi:diguanylate cyclase (GGDEF)-like protein/PAS domain S-box-containing protein